MANIIMWLAVAAFAIIIDVITASFIIMWFAVGAIVALILALMNVSFGIQVIAFLLVSICMMAFGYPWARKKFKVQENHVKTMEQEFIGKVYKATEDIEEIGHVKIGGIYWTVSNKGEKIITGESYTVKSIDGNKLIIEKVSD